MIELPEAVVIAEQITATVAGKQVARAVANASPTSSLGARAIRPRTTAT